MGRSCRALLCAIFLLALFTLDSKGLSRVEHRGFRPANVTSFSQPLQKQWNPQQQNQYGQQQSYGATTRSPSQQWNNNPGGFNQWSPYNQSASGGSNAKSWNNYNQTMNSWQRYNQTAPNWNPQQRPVQNQTHLYPHLPPPNPGRLPLQPTPSNFNNQWNQTLLPSQQYPGVLPSNNGKNNGLPTPNKTWNAVPYKSWSATPTTPLPFYRPNQNVIGGNSQRNWWNHTEGNNNNNGATWGTPGVNTNSGTGSNSPSGNYGTGQRTWVGWGANGGQKNSTGWGLNSGQNHFPNNAQNNWQGSENNNWLGNGQGQGTGVGSSGVQLAPIGGSSMTAGGGQTPYSPSNSGIPLAPIGGVGGSVGGAGSQPAWNSVYNQPNLNPNAWNHGSKSGSSQLAPMAPLSYAGGNAINSNMANGGGSNPYANIFN